MTKDLQNRLKRYSLAAAAVGATAINADAQVTEFPLSLTVTAFGSSADFDLDGDGTDDFKVELRTWTNVTGGAAYLTPLNGNSVLGEKLDPAFLGLSYNPTAKSSGDTIGPDQAVWVGSGSSMALGASYGSGGYGNFSNKSNALIGVAIDDGASGTQYGWIRMTTVMNSGEQSITISHLALVDEPGTAILAGKGVVSGMNEYLDNNTITSVNNSNELWVKSVDISGDIVVTDLSGVEIVSAVLTSGEARINLQGTSGLCVVRIATASGVLSRKIYLN